MICNIDSTTLLHKKEKKNLSSKIFSSFFRYLYPVDKSRIDMSGGMIEETPDNAETTVQEVEDNGNPVSMRTRRKAKKE
jgi:hypothetical protein